MMQVLVYRQRLLEAGRNPSEPAPGNIQKSKRARDKRMTEGPFLKRPMGGVEQTLPCVPILTNYSVMGAPTLTYDYY